MIWGVGNVSFFWWTDRGKWPGQILSPFLRLVFGGSGNWPGPTFPKKCKVELELGKNIKIIEF